MELEVQKLLRGGEPLAALAERFGLRTAASPCGRLVVLNYHQLMSRPKTHPVVRECRGLTLEVGTWDVAARAFPRFFNHGEVEEETAAFDWADVACQEKCDGSLVLVYAYDGEVRVNTRGSFGAGPVVSNLPLSWDQLFWSALRSGAKDLIASGGLDRGTTLVFELCSPLNKVVRRYDSPVAYLLTGYYPDGGEFHTQNADQLARILGALRPRTYRVSGPADLAGLIALEADPTFEGFVVRDRAGRRLKVKNPRYVALHHLKANGDPEAALKGLVPLVLGGAAEEAEVLTYLPELAAAYHGLKAAALELKATALALWSAAQHLPTQKEFALAVKDHQAACVLFEARKRGLHPGEVWDARAQDLLAKWVKGKSFGPSPAVE